MALPRVHHVRRLALPLVERLLPSDCLHCRRRLGLHAAHGYCLACWNRLRPLPQDPCAVCGVPRIAIDRSFRDAAARCGGCANAVAPCERLAACVLYDDVARSMLLHAKFAPRRELLDAIADQVAARVVAGGGPFDAIVPLPSHPRSDLRRGFSPAGRIALRVAARSGLPIARRRLVRRWTGPVHLKRRSRAERERAAEALFRVRGRFDGIRLLLVDDVRTTGTSLDAAGRRLRDAGAASVEAAVWALRVL